MLDTGSRIQEGNKQFIHFIQSMMKERNERIQKIAFLELTTPTISDAVTETILEGNRNNDCTCFIICSSSL